MSIKNIKLTGTYTDQYQLTMSQVYFLEGQQYNEAVFDYFFRKLPFEGGYAVFAGLEDLLDVLEDLTFDESDIEFLEKVGFDAGFLKYLKDFEFNADVYACKEGDIVFPNCPVVSVKGSIIEAQIVETLLLNILNFQTLVATKASRMREVAGEGKLIDFGLRRAHSLGGYSASRACMIGGFDGTSNTMAGRDYGIPVSGTMAHSFVQNFDEEITAFRKFAEGRPDDCVLLVDTYDTLKSGVPNAIKVGQEMEEKGHRLKGIRLDSGDLAYLAKKSREMLDEAGLDYVKIAASNQLDEHVIKSLLDQKAPIDLFGVGTQLVTGQPDAKLDGVYKLSYSQKKPRIKLSENVEKTNLPHHKQVFRTYGEDGKFWGADAIGLHEEETVEKMYHPYEEHKSLSLEGKEMESLMHKVMEKGKRLEPPKNWKEIREFNQERMEKLPFEYKRFDNPHIYKVGISELLKEERDKLIDEYKKEIKA